MKVNRVGWRYRESARKEIFMQKLTLRGCYSLNFDTTDFRLVGNFSLFSWLDGSMKKQPWSGTWVLIKLSLVWSSTFIQFLINIDFHQISHRDLNNGNIGPNQMNVASKDIYLWYLILQIPLQTIHDETCSISWFSIMCW